MLDSITAATVTYCTYHLLPVNKVWLGMSEVILFISTFLLSSYGFYYMDNHKGWWSKYKFEVKLANKDKVPYKEIVPNSLENLGILGIYYTGCLYFDIFTIKPIDTLDLMAELTIYFLTFATVFHYGHRLLHTKYLYKYHKIHHEVYADKGISAIYDTFLDLLIEAIIPSAFLLPFYQFNLLTVNISFTVIAINIITTHSGYELPYMTSSRYHMIHHLYSTKNYGPVSLFDTLHGSRLDNISPEYAVLAKND